MKPLETIESVQKKSDGWRLLTMRFDKWVSQHRITVRKAVKHLKAGESQTALDLLQELLKTDLPEYPPKRK